MTTSAGPFTDDVFFVLTDADGRSETLPLGEDPDLLPRLQKLPGFDNETFIEAMSCTDVAVSVLCAVDQPGPSLLTDPSVPPP